MYWCTYDIVVGEKVNVLEVGDSMSKRGWHLNALTGPAAVHIACTVSHPGHSQYN